MSQDTALGAEDYANESNPVLPGSTKGSQSNQVSVSDTKDQGNEGKPVLLDSAVEEHLRYSEKGSDVVRVLLMAAAGLICWLAGGADAESVLTNLRKSCILQLSLCFAVIGILFDLVQYVLGSLGYGMYQTALDRVWQRRNEITSKEFENAWKKLRCFGIKGEGAELPTTSAECVKFFEEGEHQPGWIGRGVNGLFTLKTVFLLITYFFVLYAIIYGS